MSSIAIFNIIHLYLFYEYSNLLIFKNATNLWYN